MRYNVKINYEETQNGIAQFKILKIDWLSGLEDKITRKWIFIYTHLWTRFFFYIRRKHMKT